MSSVKLIYRCHVSADFTLEKPKKNKLSKMRCISFNNTYSLMVQGNNVVSFVVSENTSIYKKRPQQAYNYETIIPFKNGTSDYPLPQ